MKIRAVSHGRLPFLTIAASDIGHDIMKKRNFCPMAAAVLTAAVILQPFSASAGALGQIRSIAKSIISGEPKEVEELRQMEVAQSEEGHQEYYFKQLTEEEQRVYRELLKGIRAREKEFYLTISDDDSIDRSYHAVLKDHPEIFWVHNREKIYKTTYSDSDYCVFTPGYTYTDSEIDEIQTAMEQSFQEVRALIPEDAGDYEKVRIVYTYVIDHTQYQTGEDDQSIAGVFWKKSAVCAGYAGAVQYLLERLDIPCIYVDGSTKGSTEGHAWDIVKIGQEYYYVDATNGDQPDFLNGDAAQLEEHKTIIYDYLCPFPEEYEKTYTPSEELTVPACTAKNLDFYVLNQGYFEDYSWQDIYDYCKMRMDNGAAVVRFKFGSQEAFSEACRELLDDGVVQNVAQYYMKLHGLGQVEYHYGVMDNLNIWYKNYPYILFSETSSGRFSEVLEREE